MVEVQQSLGIEPSVHDLSRQCSTNELCTTTEQVPALPMLYKYCTMLLDQLIAHLSELTPAHTLKLSLSSYPEIISILIS